MRTETTTRTLYQFDELSEKAQEKALEKLWDLNVDHEWWDYITDDIEANGEVSGLYCVYGKEFDLNSKRYVSITNIGYRLHALLNNCARTAADSPDFYMKLIAPFWDSFTIKERKQLLRLEKYDIITDLSGATSSDRHSQHSNVEWFDCHYHNRPSGYKSHIAKLCHKLEEAWHELIERLEWYYLDMLQREYDYQTSREQVIESIRANEYEFTEHGEMA